MAPATTATAYTLFDFDVYAQAGDGCMMEGVASEAASFAAHQRLSNLCWIYDSNRVTIEGHTDITFTEDVAARFVAYGWNVTSVRGRQRPRSGGAGASTTSRPSTRRPTLIVVHSHIGYGTPVEDTPKAHGEPLGPEGVKATKRFLGWPEDAEFLVPDGVYEHFADGIGARGRRGARGLGGDASTSTGPATPAWPRRSSRCSAGSFPTAGMRTIPTFPADAEGHRDPRLVRARC